MARIGERAFNQQVVDLARMYGWLVYRQWTSIHSPAGWPDLVLCRPPRLLYRELKVGKGRLSSHQETWRDALLAAGQDWAEWRPEDMEAIIKTLAA